MITGSGIETRPGELADHPASDPTLSQLRPDRSVIHEALGFTVRFETNDERISAASAPVLGPARPDVAVEPDIVIRLLSHHVDEPEDWNPEPPVIREQLGVFSIVASRATFVSGDQTSGVTAGFVSETVARMSEYLQTTIVQSAFLMAINTRVLGAIHTACVARNGRTLMLRGAPGAGKSTTAYVALRSGFSLVGEDVVFPRRKHEDDEIMLHGVPWMLYLLPDAVGFFPELRDVPLVERFTGERKIGISVPDSFPGLGLDRTPLGSSVFLQRSRDGGTRLIPLNDIEARCMLLETSIEFERRAAAEHGLWDAMLEYPAYRLEVGPDPFAVVPLLEELVADGSGECCN